MKCVMPVDNDNVVDVSQVVEVVNLYHRFYCVLVYKLLIAKLPIYCHTLDLPHE